jgi:hypothetical protein
MEDGCRRQTVTSCLDFVWVTLPPFGGSVQHFLLLSAGRAATEIIV